MIVACSEYFLLYFWKYILLFSTVTHPRFLRNHQALSKLPPVQPFCPLTLHDSKCCGERSSLNAPRDSIARRSADKAVI